MASTPSTDAAEILFNVATILEATEGNPYTIRAYRKTARALLRGEGINLADDIPGLGPRTRRRIIDILTRSAVDEPVAT